MIGILVPSGILAGAGLVVLSSVAQALFLKQLIWVGVGTALVIAFLFLDWRALLNHRGVIVGLYAAGVALLLIVLFIGPVIRNVRGWITLGPFTLQPVEVVKVALILAFARYFSRRHMSVARTRYIAESFLLFAIPAFLVALQPDVGSALILFCIWAGFLLTSGLPPRRVALGAVVLGVAGILLWSYGLREYQRERIVGLVYPERDALGVNYSVIQSKIAIGSGGLWGKGYGQGTQAQLGFLTEPSTDFALSALFEEWGWAGGAAVVVVFVALVIGVLRVGIYARSNFEKFVCLGTAILLGTHFFLNAGSATGIVPVVGVPFPFLSYGGSNFLTNALLLAIVNAIDARS